MVLQCQQPCVSGISLNVIASSSTCASWFCILAYCAKRLKFNLWGQIFYTYLHMHKHMDTVYGALTKDIHQHDLHLYSQLWVYKWLVCVLHYCKWQGEHVSFMTLPAVKLNFMLHISASVGHTVWIYSTESGSRILLFYICLLCIHRTVCGSRPCGNLLFTCEYFWSENYFSETDNFSILIFWSWKCSIE